MEEPLTKRTNTWSSDLTYHSLSEDEDPKKTYIYSNDPDESYFSSEQPKVALRKRFRWIHGLVHILPILATAAVVQLSIRGQYWADELEDSSRWEILLQLLAKLHEILIVGSLSAMVLHIFRRMLVGTKGIPLGLMVGAFQMGSAEYLISKSFWKPFRHSLKHKQIKTSLVALALGSSIIYTFLVGPASAGALTPDQDWWDMRKPFNHSLPLTSYISRDTSALFPTALKNSSIAPDCLTDDYWNSLNCPAGGFDVLVDWAWTRAQEGYWYNLTDGQHYNPTMQSSFSGQAQRDIVSALIASKNSSTPAAMSATLHASVLSLSDAFWHYVRSNIVGEINKTKRPKFLVSPHTPVSIPLVQVQCVSYDFGLASTSDEHLTFDTSAMVNGFSESQSNTYAWTTWNVPDAAWNFSRPQPWNRTQIKWIDASEVKGTQDESLPSSLAAVVTVPVFYTVTNATGMTVYQQGSLTTPCVIDARWAATDVEFNTTEYVVRTGLTDWLDSTNLTTGDVNIKAALSKRTIGDPISISPAWASSINSRIVKRDEDSIYHGLPLVEQILQGFVTAYSEADNVTILNFASSTSTGGPWTQDVANEISIVLSTVMADWVSRAALEGTDFTTVLSKPTDGNVSTIDLLAQTTAKAYGDTPVATLEHQTPVAFDVQRYGWGYGLRSEATLFSIVTLLIHVALVVLYFGYSFVFWYRAKGWTSNSWGTIGELVALAVLSPPATELKNSGGGINKSRTWMTTLRIREAHEDPEHLELVVGTRGGTVVPDDHKLKIDKAYS
ncbi:hypothetical protein ANO14919_081810 [Xylariales sp. No.14919]|nr:hypothetical protein ANO14919_081810 [Xylariales sp. No.14919]